MNLMELAPEVRKRRKLELRIVRRVVRDVLKAGYALNINNGGDTNELKVPTTKFKEILEEMFATDEEHLLLYKDGKRVGWVFFVYGNDGYDAVNNYSGNLEELMKGANDLSDKLAG